MRVRQRIQKDGRGARVVRGERGEGGAGADRPIWVGEQVAGVLCPGDESQNSCSALAPVFACGQGGAQPLGGVGYPGTKFGSLEKVASGADGGLANDEVGIGQVGSHRLVDRGAS
ncbi:hypothetical protein [Kitasatospora sp. NPDC017646]|uniref:hypothetical protein n=1 Tax=Kitasatospora sp. NPDC017646 TaxID=3364024 RepID=UPI0037B22E94